MVNVELADFRLERASLYRYNVALVNPLVADD